MTSIKYIGAVSAFLVILLLSIVAFGSWGTVSAGHRGILLRNGAVMPDIKGEGLYFKTPWIESVKEMDIRTRKEDVKTDGASKDLQTVSVHLRLILVQIQRSWRRYTRPLELATSRFWWTQPWPRAAKAVISQFTAEELITKREIVRDDIKKLLTSKLTPLGLRTEAINIINFDFSKTFNAAIEAKVTAEQNALAAKNKLSQIKFEAEQKVAEARGKAEAISIESAALQYSPQILQLRALEKWDGKMPQYMGASQLPFISISAK